jgi:hypothetical protein
MAQRKSKERPALVPPSSADRDWQQKIAIAQAAREQGKSLRADKPASFRAAVGRSR